MKALIRGERNGSVGVVAGLIAVAAALVVSIGLNLKQSKDLHDIKATLIDRCQARQASDARTREDLQGRIDLYAAIVDAELHNQFIDDAFRARRITPYRAAMSAAQAALEAIPPAVDCNRVYASVDQRAHL